MPTGATVDVNVSTSAQNRIRVFRWDGAAWNLAYPGGASFAITAALVAAGDVTLGIEGTTRLSPTWNGVVTLTLEVRNSGGTLLGTDAVLLRMAPIQFVDNTWQVEQVHVVSITSGGSQNSAFRTTLQTITGAAGVALIEIPGASYNNDRWIQDSFEPGVVFLPQAAPPGRRRIDSDLQCARWRDVDPWVLDDLLGPDFGVQEFVDPDNNSLNYGGNLEIIPPHTSPGGTVYPFGRILIGGGTSTTLTGAPVSRFMVQAQRDYLNAQALQDPFLQEPTEWLAVGHIDEYTMVLPAPATARGWVLLMASPAVARTILENVQTGGGGASLVFAGRAGFQTTVDAILADAALMALNQEVQNRLDVVRTNYMNEIGLAASEIIELPILFEDQGGGLIAAYNPGVSNMLIIPAPDGTIQCIVPDPEGPDFPATDAWQDDIVNKLTPLGTGANPVIVTFTDVFFSYHTLLGEAHCGTNTVRTPPATVPDWWESGQ